MQMLLFCMDGSMLGCGGHFQLLLCPSEFNETVLCTLDLTSFSWRPKNLATVLADYKSQTAVGGCRRILRLWELSLLEYKS